MINKFLLNIFSFLSSPVYAGKLKTPPTLHYLADAFDKVYAWIFPIGGLIAVAMIIYGGYMWMISGGEPQRKQMAQGTLTWAVLGLVFLLLIKGLLMVVLSQISA